MKTYIDPGFDIISFSAKEIIADDIDFSIVTCDGGLYSDECDGEWTD